MIKIFLNKLTFLFLIEKNINIIILIGILTILLIIGVKATEIITANQVTYKNSTVQTELDNLFSAIDINEKIAKLEEEISTLKNTSTSVEEIYPVGSIYISTNSTNPSTLFEGTEWEQYSQGRTLVGTGTGQYSRGVSKTFTNNQLGGEYEHQLTINEITTHNHSLGIYGQNIYYFSDAIGSSVVTPYYPDGQSAAFTLQTESNGAGHSHNNIQPYITIYIWKRIS